MIAPAQVEEEVRQCPDLPRTDVREQLDLAVRRGWAELGRRAFRHTVLLSFDLAAVGQAAILTNGILRYLTPASGHGGVLSPGLIVFLCLVQPLALGAFGAYGGGKQRREFGRVVPAVMTAALLGWIFDWIAVQPASSPGVAGVLLYSASAICLIHIGRCIVDLLVEKAYRRGIGQRRVLVIGTAAESKRVTEMLERYGGAELKVVGTLSPGSTREPRSVGTVAELEEQLGAASARGVIIASSFSSEAMETIIRKTSRAGATVSIIPGTLHRFGKKLDLRRARTGILFEVLPEMGFPQLALKRVMDIVCSFLILLLTWPLFLLIAVAIKLSSPGPVFFKQARPGRGGRRFKMLKFRTMRVDAEEVLRADPELYQKFLRNNCKLPPDEDPRVFRVGSWLRRTSLDELPQLINVLRGEMSLVGPRPVVGPELDCYGASRDLFLTAKPGMTGYWQVNGRSRVMYPERAEMDLYYVRHWSLILDLKILLLTIPAVISQRGAH